MVGIFSFVIACCMLAEAQEKKAASEKKEPEARMMEVLPAEVHAPATRQPDLPKIDLPEFIIVGTSTRSMPDMDKLAVDESDPGNDVAVLSPPARRDRETSELATRFKERLEDIASKIYSGKAEASLGSFFTPKVGLWFGQTLQEYQYTLEGRYHRMKGFAPNTDRSGGGARAHGSIPFPGSLASMSQSTLSGGIVFDNQSYRFYGSTVPTLARATSSAGIDVAVDNARSPVFPFAISLALANLAVADSSTTEAESQIRFGWRSNFALSSIDLVLQGNALFASLSGPASDNLSFLNLSFGTPSYRWNSVMFSGFLNIYSATGMDGQSVTRVYPHLSGVLVLSDAHRLGVSYKPEVRPSSLSLRLEQHPYVSSASVIRHSDANLNLAVDLESDWAYGVRSRFSVGVQSVSDYPLYADSLSRGIWSLAYAGKTSIVRFEAEMFANLNVNDYFSTTMTVNSSSNSTTGEPVPYIPGAELNIRYRHVFGYGFSIEPSLGFLHERQTSMTGTQSLPGVILLGVLGSFQPAEFFRVFVALQNLTDQRYKLWEGYQELPFTVSVGMTVQW
ncbi:MAG: TonB-dependent receptor [Bacteroidota bacterium]